MNMLKKTFAGVAIAATMALSANAAVVTVGGVTWDTAAVNSNGLALDFAGTTASVNQLINPLTGEVSGNGIISRINDNASFCTGCTLTFQFSGFNQISGSLPTPGGTGLSTLGYSGGSVKVFVNSGSDSLLWLDMAGHAVNGSTLNGYINQVGGTITNMFGGGYLDVVGGAAKDYFDTNTQIGGADFLFSTTFTTFNGPLDAYGSGMFTSKTAEVPEPASIALLGLGLVGLAAARRRKQAK